MQNGRPLQRCGRSKGSYLCKISRPCPNGTILLEHPQAMKPLPAMCGSWRCSGCGPRKARRLRKRLLLTTPTRLITLTLRPDPAMTASQQLAVANRSWSILWRRYRRKFGPRAVGYAKIVELTKAGTPHLHILAEMPFIHARALSADWQRLTGAFIVDVRRVKSQRGVAIYLSSYLTKALNVPEGMRKWSAARGFVPPYPPQELEPGEIAPSARYVHALLDNIVANYLAAGWLDSGGWLIAPAGALPP